MFFMVECTYVCHVCKVRYVVERLRMRPWIYCTNPDSDVKALQRRPIDRRIQVLCIPYILLHLPVYFVSDSIRLSSSRTIFSKRNKGLIL